MQHFTDTTGRQWSIELPIGTVIRVRSTSRFDLFDSACLCGGSGGGPTEPASLPLSSLLATDLVAFWELLWLLVEPQAKEANVTAEQFGQDMAGDCLLVAQTAFFDEWRDFFLKLKRSDQATLVEKTMKYIGMAMEAIKQRAAHPGLAELDSWVAKKMDEDLSASLGNLQVSLGSTLGRSPSASSGV